MRKENIIGLKTPGIAEIKTLFANIFMKIVKWGIFYNLTSLQLFNYSI